MATAPAITVVILTFDEARHIARAIASVRAIAHEIVVVDSFSRDDTVAIAEREGARVVQHAFVSQSQQFAWALDHAGIATPWVLRLDADEIIGPDLAATIARELPRLPGDVTGVNFARRHIFLGRWVRHGGRYPLKLLRLFRLGAARVEDRWMDEHIVVTRGRTVDFAGEFADWNLGDLSYFVDKHNRYATREAMDVLGHRYGLLARDDALTARTASRQAGIKRWIKERVYNRLPLWAGPSGYFVYRVVFQLGLLDGREGMIYHVLQGFWYHYLVKARIFELDRALAGCATAEERRARLSALTGYDLPALDNARPHS